MARRGLICSHRSFYVPAHTTVPGRLRVYYGHQRDKCCSRLLCSYILCGLVGNGFKLVSPAPIVPPLARLVNLEVKLASLVLSSLLIYAAHFWLARGVAVVAAIGASYPQPTTVKRSFICIFFGRGEGGLKQISSAAAVLRPHGIRKRLRDGPRQQAVFRELAKLGLEPERSLHSWLASSTVGSRLPGPRPRSETL